MRVWSESIQQEASLVYSLFYELILSFGIFKQVELVEVEALK